MLTKFEVNMKLSVINLLFTCQIGLRRSQILSVVSAGLPRIRMTSNTDLSILRSCSMMVMMQYVMVAT